MPHPGWWRIEITPSAVRRLLRRLDNAGGGPTLKQWSQLVEADNAGRGEGARHTRNYVPDWIAVAGIPQGKMWAIIVAQSEEAQDDGVFHDEAGAIEWLRSNEAAILQEAQRRLQKAAAAYEKKKAAQLIITKARAAEQKAEAKALTAAKRAELEAAS